MAPRPALGGIKVEIRSVEVAGSSQPFPIPDHDRSGSDALNQALSCESLQYAINVDSGHAGCVRKLILSHGKLVVELLPQAYRLQLERKLAEQMRNAGWSIPATYVGNPFSMDRAIHESVIPERLIDGGSGVAQLPKSFDGYLRHFA